MGQAENPEIDLSQNVTWVETEDNPAQAEYMVSKSYDWALTGRSLTVTSAMASGASGTGALIEATSQNPDKLGAAILAIVALGAAATSYRTGKQLILGVFRAGYSRGYSSALNEVNEDVNDALDAMTKPSDN